VAGASRVMTENVGCELFLDELLPLFLRFTNEVWVQFKPKSRAGRASELRIAYLHEFWLRCHFLLIGVMPEHKIRKNWRSHRIPADNCPFWEAQGKFRRFGWESLSSIKPIGGRFLMAVMAEWRSKRTFDAAMRSGTNSLTTPCLP